MTFKTFSRAGLMALFLGVFLGICVDVSSFSPSLRAGAAPAPPRRRAAGLTPARDPKSPKRMLAQFRRHRLDAHLDGHRADDDHPRPRPVLRRHGPQEERRRHGHDELRHHLSDQRSMAVLHLQPGVPGGRARRCYIGWFIGAVSCKAS